MHELGVSRTFWWNTAAVLSLLMFSSPSHGASLSPLHVERDISLPVTSTVDYNLSKTLFAENGNGSLRDEIAAERCYLFGNTSWKRGKYTGPTEFVVLFFGYTAIPQVTYPRGRIDLFVDGRPFSIHLPEFTIGNGKFFFALYVGDDGLTYYANYVKDTTFGGGVAHDLLDQAFKLPPEEAFTREYLAAEGATITVGNGPGYDFQKIEAAIWHCPYGGEVVVAPGTYYEHNIIMKEGVTLRSQVRHCATIDGEGDYSLIHMNNKSRIDGFILTHGNEGTQPLFGAAGGFEVRNCIVNDNSRTGVRGGDDFHLGSTIRWSQGMASTG